ncbi:PREDICTED: juvenile hormone esterase-like isoform X1 [Ceratosolen solmsi marchali]|uniref:Carboxylic ester hydrolase n=1 Tax=Ceratosolen solmsi marchali TaxID=326594 RepID=A0AAJ7DSX4_9HYME|nr:PREDICTED: juvenile hormone esterase-like isoform X1 [Ceratosolen solmsi marchali]
MNNSVVVKIPCGSLRGVVERSFEGYDYCAFKGIPYAEPPVGQLRFRDPIPVKPWSGVRDATNFGPMCIQNDFMSRSIVGSDDCLYLNIYVKFVDPNNHLPVMVFIHGGGFIFGSGDDLFYGPDYLLRKDIVLVTFNYRLGVLGFLNFGHEVAPGNQGLKDQVMLLQWVNKNIKHFGGDPSNITIFGESAGGSSVHYLTLSSLATGLFHKAISHSGVACNPWACTSDIQNAYKLCKNLGKDSTDPKELVDFLRSIDCTKIIQAQENMRSYENRLYCTVVFGPGVDNKSKEPFMPIHPLKAMEKGINVPLIIGCNVCEGIMILPGLKDSIMEEFEHNFEKYLNPIYIFWKAFTE